MTKQELIEKFMELGIGEGDNIFVTSSLSRFGHVDGGADAVVDALWECVGQGTIVMPSFNFSIFRDKEIVLDIDNTPSEMGAITEAFRKRANRTTNLFHPLSYHGDLSYEISHCDMIDTWGDKSPYAFMEERDFKILLLGTDFYSCPVFHYIEQKYNVPYRVPVEYEGYIMKDGVKTPQRCRRLRRAYGDSDSNKCYTIMNGNMREIKIGKAVCRYMRMKVLREEVGRALQGRPDYFLSGGLLSFMPTMETFNMITGVEELFKHERDLVSKGFKDALDYIGRFIPLRYHTWKSGEKIETWTVPEGGVMHVGEWTVKGYGSETIILPIHLDHAGMANDNLSGVVVAIELALRLLRTSDLHYTYKFLFVPETIGTMAYLSRFGNEYAGGIVIDSVGTKDSLVITKTKFPNGLNDYIEGDTNEFLSNAHLWSGNDERVLECWNIPSVQFSRSPFKQYHTFKDTPEIVVERKLNEALSEVYDFILRIERDFVPTPTYKGVPCLSAIGLWELDLGIEKIYHLLGYGLSVAQIAKKIDMPFKYVYDFIEKMRGKGYVASSGRKRLGVDSQRTQSA